MPPDRPELMPDEEILTDEFMLLLQLELALHRGTHGVMQDSQEQTQSKPLLNSTPLDHSLCQ